MAITKMEEVTLVSNKRNQGRILQAIQGIQSIEIRGLYQNRANNQWAGEYFPDTTVINKETELSVLDNRLKDIQETIQFIQHHDDNRQKKLHLKRQELSLQDLEANYLEENFMNRLGEVLDLKERWEQLTEKRNRLEEEEEWPLHWQRLDIVPSMYTGKTTIFEIGTISTANFESFKEELSKFDDVYMGEIGYMPKQTYLSYVALKKSVAAIEEIARRCGFNKETYPYEQNPKEKLQETKQQLSIAHKQQKEITTALGQCSGYIQEFEWVEEVTLAVAEREKVKGRFIHATHLIVLQGWVDAEEKQGLMHVLNETISKEDTYVSFETPNSEGIQQGVPAKLKNHPLIKPFKLLIEVYNLPRYEEVDPTPWMTPFYLVFFRMMAANVDYRLLILIGTILTQKLFVLPRGMKHFVEFFKILSVPSIIWGLICSSFFEQTLPKKPFGIRLPFPILSTTDDINTILILSVIFDLVQILIGLFVATKENIRGKDYLSAVSDGFTWQKTLIGIVIALADVMLIKSITFVYLDAGLSIITTLCILIAPTIQSSSKVEGATRGAYNLYGLTGYIGDLVSHVHLMALGISGGNIGVVFSILVTFMPPAARFSVGILLIIALHALNVSLTLLSVYVHGAWLQYVGFFGKFYTGGGHAFDLLKTAGKYVNINHKKKSNE